MIHPPDPRNKPALRLFLLPLGLTLLILLPSACSRRTPQPVSLLTTEPEAILWTDIYNAQNDGPPVQCRYLRPDEFRRRTVRTAPDLLLDRSHGSPPPEIGADPVPLPFPPEYYPGIKTRLAGTGPQTPMVSVPITFDLPVIVYTAEDQEADKAAPLFSLEELQTLGSAYNRRNNRRYTRMGFVPPWQDHFLSSAPFLFRVNFQTAPSQNKTHLKWRESQLSAMIQTLSDFIRAANGSYEAAENYKNQYLYEPPEKLLADGRIRLYQTTLSRYFSLPEEYRQTLSFGYPSRRGFVPVENTMLFITAYTPLNKNPALSDFYTWLTSGKGQEAILREKRRKGLSRFGLAGGLSTLPSVNTSLFPEQYPALQTRTLPKHDIGFPKALPSHWPRLEEEVILPWLNSVLSLGREEAGDLESRIQNWTRRTLSN